MLTMKKSIIMNSKNTIRIGLISLTDNEPEWEAKDDSSWNKLYSSSIRS